LNELPGATSVVSATNADILREIIDVPLLSRLTENMDQLPLGWWETLGLSGTPRMSSTQTQV